MSFGNRKKHPTKITSSATLTNKSKTKKSSRSKMIPQMNKISYSSEEEEQKDYKLGGYHPVRIGEIFNRRYKALCKIGWGIFSTVWLVQDLKEGIFSALKIVKSSRNYSQAAKDEIKILKKIAKEDPDGNSNVVRLLDQFQHKGPNGNHWCMVFELLDEKNLYSYMKRYDYKGLPIEIVKELTRQTLVGLDHLHRKCEIIHTDIKPENIMLYKKIGNLSERIRRIIEKTGLNVEEYIRLNQKKITMKRGLKQKSFTKYRKNRLLASKSKTSQQQNKTKKGRHQKRKKKGENIAKRTDFKKKNNYLKKKSINQNHGNIKRGFKKFENKNIGSLKTQFQKNKPFAFGTNKIEKGDPLFDMSHNQKENSKSSKQSQKNKFQSKIKSQQKPKSKINQNQTLKQQQTIKKKKKIQNPKQKGNFHTNQKNKYFSRPKIKQKQKQKQKQQTNKMNKDQINEESENGKEFLDCDGLEEVKIIKVINKINIIYKKKKKSPRIVNSIQDFSNFDPNEKLKMELLQNFTPPDEKQCFVPQNQTQIKKINEIFQTNDYQENKKTTPRIKNLIQNIETNLKNDKKLTILSKNNSFSPNLNFLRWKSNEENIKTKKNNAISYSNDTANIDNSDGNDNDNDHHHHHHHHHNNKKKIHHNLINGQQQQITKKKTNLQHNKKIPNFNKKKNFNVDKNSFKATKTTKSSSTIKKQQIKRQSDGNEQNQIIKCKIVDLGNACWFEKHYTSDIQTRQYRSPEVILGHEYDSSADIWSLGCMIFELLTGDVLFSPKGGGNYSKDEDHLALIMEYLGRIPRSILISGKYSSELVDWKGDLKHLKNLEFWPLESLLVEKYNFSKKDAKEISDFLKPMFEYHLDKRSTAHQSLQHDWLKKKNRKKFIKKII
ncbi:hypothetical protein M0813_01750 [Anaeramoeba flamelloides]|uniref:non-specific serine/threonine protein kinase n=1 Tax=Anaeramoeba flamelloides TaxID=1746091 RepID=A0ABQ8YX68_9EUKA|nr:hypothetical protein M0813_01750 [Anaeramoeba flamelloides]